MGDDSKRFLLIDTETIGQFGSQLVYDTGLLVVDGDGKEYAQASFLTRGIFDDIKLMATAYYARRYNKYLDEIATGETKVVEWQEVLQTIADMVETHGITTVCAYNENFDNTSMENTTEHFFGEGNTQWIPPEVEHFCIWNASCHAIFDAEYIRVAREKEWLTEAGNVKTSAEMAYRYITGQDDFQESHTGLDDCKIEAQLLTYILKSGKEFDGTPKEFPMRRVFEMDRVWQVADLEKKEASAAELEKEIQKMFNRLNGRMKTIYKRREQLGYTEDTAETVAKCQSTLNRGGVKGQIAQEKLKAYYDREIKKAQGEGE